MAYMHMNSNKIQQIKKTQMYTATDKSDKYSSVWKDRTLVCMRFPDNRDILRDIYIERTITYQFSL